MALSPQMTQQTNQADSTSKPQEEPLHQLADRLPVITFCCPARTDLLHKQQKRVKGKKSLLPAQDSVCISRSYGIDNDAETINFVLSSSNCVQHSVQEKHL